MWKRFPAARKPAAIVILVLALCVALFIAPEKTDFRSSALFAKDPSSKETHVDVAAHLDRNILGKNDVAVLDFSIQNNNTEPLTDVHFSIAAPGFAWKPAAASSQIPGTLPANSNVTASIPLQALARSGSYNISIFYSWSRQSRYGSALSLGPLKMVGIFGQDNWSRFLARLTLPIVLAALGYYFQLRQKARDERQQVRQNILPLVMSLAERHYMPIVTSARILIGNYDRTKKKPPASSLEEVSFDALFLLKRMDYLRRDKGQIFFQDNAAEALAADAWFVLREKFRSVMLDADVELALQKMGNDDRFADSKRYRMHLQPPSRRFQEWIASAPDEFERYLQLVDVIQAVFRFEANRPFSDHWYGTPKKLSFETDGAGTAGFLEKPPFPVAKLSGAAVKRIESLKVQWPLYLATIKYL